VFIPNPILGCRRSNTAATLAERCSGAAPRLVRLEQSVAPAAPTCHDDRQTLVPTEYLRAAWRTCGPAAAAARSLRSPATLTSRDRVGDISIVRAVGADSPWAAGPPRTFDFALRRQRRSSVHSGVRPPIGDERFSLTNANCDEEMPRSGVSWHAIWCCSGADWWGVWLEAGGPGRVEIPRRQSRLS
jgi:hypothetical protein